MVRALILAGLLAISGCQTTGGSFCSIAKPVRLSQSAIDALSDAEVAAVLAHNRKMQKLCGVKP